MTKINILTKIFVTTLIIYGILVMTVPLIHAQTTIDLTVSPPSQDLDLQPGDTKNIQIKFYNRSDETLTGIFKKADFLVLDKEGSPTLFDTSAANNRFAATSWITLSQDQVAIAPKTQVVVTETIKVPSDAYPCARYASVYFEPTPPRLGGRNLKLESGTSVAFKLASLIYMNVAGQCKENAYISKLTVPTFLEYGPIPVSFELLNRSDYHVAPEMVATLTSIDGKQIDAKPLPHYNIFPDAVRTYTASLGKQWMIGQYKVDITGGYGKLGRSVSGYATIIIFPWRIALLITLSLIILVILIKAVIDRSGSKTSILEREIAVERKEIEKLKNQLDKRAD